MAYSSDQLPSGLDTISTVDSGDLYVIGDNSDSGRVKAISKADQETQQDARTATLTNKTISVDDNTVSGIAATSFVLSNSSGNVDGSAAQKAIPSGTVVGHTDTQTLTNKDISATTNTYRAASETVTGAVEIATTAETSTGTDGTRAVSPDGLSQSIYGQAAISLQVFAGTTDMATGDGKAYFSIPSNVGGMDLTAVHARVVTAGTTSTCTIQIANVTQSADMLSTKISIDSTETGSDTAATPAVIDTGNDDVATNDLIRIDVDTVHTTPAKGLIVTLVFKTP